MSQRLWSIAELVREVNEWCVARGIEPLNNGAGGEVTVRSLRFYQSMGLVDRPLPGGRAGFTEKHRWQLIAIRRLQARGLTLARIQHQLAGRSEEELQRVAAHDGEEPAPVAGTGPAPIDSGWTVTPLDHDVLLLTRGGRVLTAGQRLRILDLLRSVAPPQPATPEVGGFSPETD